MNFLAVYPQEIRGEQAVLTGTRAEYVRRVHSLSKGKQYEIVLLSQGRTSGIVLSDSPSEVVLTLQPLQSVLPTRSVTLVTGVCRPQTVRKILQAGVSFEVREICMVGSRNSEKSYFSGKPLVDQTLQQRILLETVEQTGNPYLPSISLEKKFHDFLYTRLMPELELQSSIVILSSVTGTPVLDPATEARNTPVILIVGPEKGWASEERQHLLAAGCIPYSLGSSMLRVEVATIALLSRIRQYD